MNNLDLKIIIQNINLTKLKDKIQNYLIKNSLNVKNLNLIIKEVNNLLINIIYISISSLLNKSNINNQYIADSLPSVLPIIISAAFKGNQFNKKEFLNVLLDNNSTFSQLIIEDQKRIINELVNEIIEFLEINFFSKIVDVLLSNNFFWGASTSAYQTEGFLTKGGQGISQWDVWSQNPGNIVDGSTAQVTCNTYLQTDDLIQMLLNTGCNSFRFSISWTRIFPLGKGNINQEGVDHYNLLINKLKENNITPFVCLYHWDLPFALSKKYNGWLCENGEIWEDFSNYADFCFKTYGDRVKHWVTINEPQTISVDCYEYNYQAPGIGNSEGFSPLGWEYKVAHNLLLSHAYAVNVYRKKYLFQKGKIGIICNMDWGEPLTLSKENIEAAERRNVFWGAWFYDPIFFGNYPQIMIDLVGSRLPKFTPEQQILLQGSIDVFYLNNYSAEYIYAEKQTIPGWNYDQQNAQSYTNTGGQLIGPQTAASWLHIVPYAPKKVLLWFQERYSFNGKGTGIGIVKNGIKEELDVMITEQGMPILNQDQSTSYEEARHDKERINYYESYLSNIAEAIEIGGLKFKGYFPWSIIDNWEWANGFTERFGLNYLQDTNDENFKIYLPKDSAIWYKNYLNNNPNGPTNLNPSSLSKYPWLGGEIKGYYLWNKPYQTSPINLFSQVVNTQVQDGTPQSSNNGADSFLTEATNIPYKYDPNIPKEMNCITLFSQYSNVVLAMENSKPNYIKYAIPYFNNYNKPYLLNLSLGGGLDEGAWLTGKYGAIYCVYEAVTEYGKPFSYIESSTQNTYCGIGTGILAPIETNCCTTPYNSLLFDVEIFTSSGIDFLNLFNYIKTNPNSTYDENCIIIVDVSHSCSNNNGNGYSTISSLLENTAVPLPTYDYISPILYTQNIGVINEYCANNQILWDTRSENNMSFIELVRKNPLYQKHGVNIILPSIYFARLYNSGGNNNQNFPNLYYYQSSSNSDNPLDCMPAGTDQNISYDIDFGAVGFFTNIFKSNSNGLGGFIQWVNGQVDL